MNFLDLCRRLRQETGIADSGPSQVTEQTGDMQRIVDWINDAWLRLQSSREDWRFMWVTATATTTIGNQVLSLAGNVNTIDCMYINGQKVTEIEWPDYRSLYRNLSSGPPSRFAVRPDDVIVLNTLPDQAYSVEYDYYKKPVKMVNGIEVPGSLDERYHMILVWGGLVDYALFDEAPELLQKGRINYEDMLAEIEDTELPELKFAGPLA